MKFFTVLYRSYALPVSHGGDGLVHQVVQDGVERDTGKSYGYRVLCGYGSKGMIHLHYNDKQVTCLVCLGTPCQRKCNRTACDAVMDPARMYIHRDNRQLYCPICANRINDASRDVLLTPVEAE